MNGAKRRLSVRRRLAWAALPVLTLLALAEGTAWIVDGAVGYRAKLLNAYLYFHTVDDPIPAAAETGLPEKTLAIRPQRPDPPRRQPYRIGGRVIEGATAFVEHELVQPDLLVRAGEQRTFVVGESAAYGFPYDYPLTFAGLLDAHFAPDRHRVFNAAQPNWTSGALVPVVRRIVEDFSPNCLILFLGNNEWVRWVPETQSRLSKRQLAIRETLAHSRALAGILYWNLNRALMRQKQVLLDSEFQPHVELTGSDYALMYASDESGFDVNAWLATKQAFLTNFEQNLETMIRTAKARQVRVIVMTMPFNYKLSPAWKHPQPESFVGSHREQVRTAIREAAGHLKRQDHAAAIEVCERAIALDSQPPVLNYLLAQSLEVQGRLDEAAAAYAQSRESMIGNLGSRLSINACISRVAQAQDVELLDLKLAFDEEEQALGGHFNEHLIHDDCHPTPRGHRIIADRLIQLLTSSTKASR